LRAQRQHVLNQYDAEIAAIRRRLDELAEDEGVRAVLADLGPGVTSRAEVEAWDELPEQGED